MKINFTDILAITPEELFPLVVLDIETTGLNPANAEIIEVSAIKYDIGFEEIDRFSTFCKPLNGITYGAFCINHLSEEFLSDYEPFSAYRDEFEEFIYGCNITGYSVDFDINFLNWYGVYFSSGVKYFDVLKLAKKKLKKAPKERCLYDQWDVENHKLTTVCDFFGICCDDAHDSLADCQMTIEAMKALLERT